MVIHFNFFIFSITAIAVGLSPQEGFLSPLNMSPDSETSFLDDINNNDDLFTDSTILDPTTDFTSGLNDLESPSFDFLASCPSTNEQPASKVRARDQLCSPNENQPSPIDGFIDNALGIFSNPADGEEQSQGAAAASSTKTDGDSVCIDPDYPVHLCCEYEGDETDMRLRSPPLGAYDVIYATMHNCRLATFVPCVYPQDKEMCCNHLSYGSGPAYRDEAMANLLTGTPGALDAYFRSNSAQQNHPPWPRGNMCYYFGIGLYRGVP